MAEVALLLLSGFVTHWISTGRALPSAIDAGALVAVTLAAALALQAMRAYDLQALRAPVGRIVRLFAVWSAVFVAAVAVAMVLRIGTEALLPWLAAWYLTAGVLVAVGRIVAALVVRRLLRAGRLDRRTAIVGGGPAAEALLKALDAQEDSEVRVCGIFDDRDDARSPDMVAGYPKLGTTDDLVEFVRRTNLDLLVFTLPITAESASSRC